MLRKCPCAKGASTPLAPPSATPLGARRGRHAVTCQASHGQDPELQRLQQLLEENNRLRKGLEQVVAQKAASLAPEKRRAFDEHAGNALDFGSSSRASLVQPGSPSPAGSSSGSGSRSSVRAGASPASGIGGSVSTVVVEPPSSSGAGARPGAGGIIVDGRQAGPHASHEDAEASVPGSVPGRLPAPLDTELTPVQAAARQLILTLDPDTAVQDKHHWMVVAVPEQPVAGEDWVVYFNKNASDALRGRPRIQMKFGFNSWELKPEDGIDCVDMKDAGVTHEWGADFVVCRIKVPANSYELNFVLSDGEGRFENNSGQDFKFAVEGGITWDDWIDSAGERAAKAAAEQAAAEQAAQEEAERQHQAYMLRQEKEHAQRRANEMRDTYEGLRAGGATVWDVGGDPTKPLWRAVPAEPAAASKALPGVEPTAGSEGVPGVDLTDDSKAVLAAEDSAGSKVIPGMELSVESETALPAEPGVGSKAGLTAEPKAGSKVKLLYNRANGPFGDIPIPEDQVLTLRYGINNWNRATSTTMKRDTTQVSEPGQDWWVGELDVAHEAAAVNFVINYYEHYDNNHMQDHKMLVGLPEGHTFDTWLASLSETFFQEMHEGRKAAEEMQRKKMQARLQKKKEAQALVKAVERRKVRHVLYTEPEVVTAGKEVTIFYNPQVTNLNGRKRIFLRGGWNRWNHARKFGPLEMTPPEEGSVHFQATVKVPSDAFKMDFVFSDVEQGDGTYDSRGGYDYHLPVEGSAVREPSLYVVHVAVEMAPIAKVGGLGDVVTALGRAVKDQGHMVEVILPMFQFFGYSPILNGQLRYETEFPFGGTHVYVTTAIVEDLRVWFIEPKNGFFETGSVYGRYDDEVRFDFFCKAALEFLLRSGRQPDILHCHDWSTAYTARTYWEDYHPYGLWKPKVVFTIHNLNYGKKKLSEAAYFCQKFTTVSPTYAFETGGNPVISSQTHKFMGIRNGIDMDLWDPETNQFLPLPYTSENAVEGKAAARKALRERLGLTGWGDKMIIGVVSRLTGQKGVHLIKHAAYRAVERGCQFVLLGSAPDPKVQGEFNALAGSLSGDVARFCFTYDEPLSHLIYAAADLIVVPSMFEPCGLTQMIAMRYGAVPCVRHTGGLKDTVFDVDYDKARAAWDVYGSSDWKRDGLDATNGFAFEGIDQGALDYAMNRAIDAWYNDRAWFHSLQKRVMEQDWSWNRPALDYIELYHGAKKA